MLSILKSHMPATALFIGSALLVAQPVAAIPLVATISGDFDALNSVDAAFWAQFTEFDAADLMAGGSFAGTVFVDKAKLPEPILDRNTSLSNAKFNPYQDPTQGYAEAPGTFLALTMNINGKVFKGGLEPIAATNTPNFQEIVGRDDFTAGEIPNPTADDTLYFTTGFANAMTADQTHERILSYTFEGLPFVDEIPDPASPPDLSVLVSGSTLPIATLRVLDMNTLNETTSVISGRITSATGLMTLEQFLAQNPAGSGDTTGDGTTDAPLLPQRDVNGNPIATGTPEDPFVFGVGGIGEFGLGTLFPIFIDPDVAVGYNYAVISGPAFASVIVPDQFSDTMFTVEFAGCGGFCSIDISAEEVFDFTTFEFGGSVLFPDGVTQFRIVGIDPDLMLDPTADNVFVTGLTFVDNGQTTADVTMSAITQFVDDSQSGGNQGGGSVTIPEPASLSLSLVGLAALWRVRRRRRVAA